MQPALLLLCYKFCFNDNSNRCYIFFLNAQIITDPYTWVWWDTGEYNRYPYGPDMGFHIWKTEEYPRIKLMHDPLDIGMIVKKGENSKKCKQT